MRRGSVVVAGGLAVALALGLGYLGWRDRRPSCVVGPDLQASCGILWGASVTPAEPATLHAFERSVGRKLAIVYEYEGIDSVLPNEEQRAAVAGGRILHLNIESREFQRPGHPPVPWADVAAGRFDMSLAAQARGVAGLHRPVVMTFEHEMESPKKLGVRGDAAQFVSAWRHVVDVYRANGASNVQWAWVVMGYQGHFGLLPNLWPGNHYVDWISWDPYNAYTCQGAPWRSFEQSVRPMYDWLQSAGRTAGIDPRKPYMLSEFGTVLDPNNPEAAASWYKQVPATLKKYPQIKAVQMWNSVANCDFRLERDREVLKAFAEAGHQPGVSAYPGW